MLPTAFLFFWTHFILFPCLKSPGEASSPPHPAVVVPLPSIRPGGFQVAVAFAQGRGFPKVLPWQPGILARQKHRHAHRNSNMRDAELPFIIFFREKIWSGVNGACLPAGISDETDFCPGIRIS